MKVRFEAKVTRGFSLSPRRFRDSLSPLRGFLLISFAKKNQEKPLGSGYFRPNKLTHFSAFTEMVYSPKTFLKNLFEMLINLFKVLNGLPRGVCSKQSLLACYIGTCSKKNPIRNYYSNQNVAPRHNQKLVTSVMRAGEGCRHKGENSRVRLNYQAVFLSFTKIVNYERSSLEC